MKKILLATTAIVGFAGAATAAEIRLSGYAEMGIFDGDAPGLDTQFHTDWQVNFNFSGETDGGVTFGGRAQIEESNSPANVNGTPRIDDESFFVSGAFGRVTLGETDGAFDWALSEIYAGTSLQDDHSTHAGAYWYTGLDGSYDDQIARYEYSFGDFAVAASAELDDDDAVVQNPNVTTSANGDVNWAVGGKWASNVNGFDVAAAAAYQDNGDFEVWGLSGSVAMSNGFSVSAGYADLDGINDGVGNGIAVDSWYGVGVAYTTGPITVGANYGRYDAVAGSDPKGWGVVANYDLGGGAVAMAGYGDSSGGGGAGSGNGNGQETWSIGLGMSF
ncbi:MAG: porin [Alphaproteobacteria bacterium HGW-Alphaproteobacteria-6]|nr:MAG: porin [Alphaproteobacteria bacterium HGW-Alphaproteobacteria-6]